jgi:lipid-binding SYLF domain-containing protein
MPGPPPLPAPTTVRSEDITPNQREDIRKSDLKKVLPVKRANERAIAAANTLKDIMRLPDIPIPHYVLGNAEVIAIFSSRIDFYPGKEESAGIVTARDPKTRQWLAPIYLTFNGGHIEGRLEDIKLDDLFKRRDGDLILIGMNQRAIPLFLADQLQLGVDALVLGGSFGDITKPGGEVAAVSNGFLAYFHHRGQIVGVSVAESVITQDIELNDSIYEEKRLTQFLQPQRVVPESLQQFLAMIQKYTDYPNTVKSKLVDLQIVGNQANSNSTADSNDPRDPSGLNDDSDH